MNDYIQPVNYNSPARQMECFLMHPSGVEIIESVWNREAKLGRGMGKLSVYHNQADQTDNS